MIGAGDLFFFAICGIDVLLVVLIIIAANILSELKKHR